MSNLRRVRSTDIDVLRSILNDEVIVDFNENVNPDLNYNITNQTNEPTVSKDDTENVNPDLNYNITNQTNEPTVSKDDTENENPLVSNKIDNKTDKKALKNKSNKPHDKPFMVTRIETKHKFTRYNDDSNQENVPIDSYKLNMSKSVPIYRSIHYKNIVETENRLDRKYEELAKMLNREVLQKTVALCDQSMNEARQLIQNSLATSRIVSSFLDDMSQSGRKTKTNFLVSNNSWHPPSFEETNDQNIGLSRDENKEQTSNKNIDKNDDWKITMENIDRKLELEIHNPNIENSTTNIFGMSATTNKDVSDQQGKSARRAYTEHMLESDEPFIRQWLTRKNQELKLERRMKREEMKIEQAISVSALAVKEHRKAASEEAFIRWISKKKINEFSINKEKYDSAESDSEICLPQAGRQPKPSQKLPTRRMMSLTRPKSVATFSMNQNIKMKIAGHQMSLSISDLKQNSPPKIDYSKYVTKTDQILLRPQTAFLQPRGMNGKTVSKPIEFQRLPRQRRTKKPKNKKKELLLEGNGEHNNKTKDENENNKISDKPNSIYSDQFSISEKEQEMLVATCNNEKSIREHSDKDEMSDNISLSSFDFN